MASPENQPCVNCISALSFLMTTNASTTANKQSSNGDTVYTASG